LQTPARECLLSRTVTHARTDTNATVFSDASLTGWGVVRYEDARCWSGVWTGPGYASRDMYYLEALAAKQAVLRQQDGTLVCLGVDNSGLYHSLRKRSSR
jgi:hypothetical protein